MKKALTTTLLLSAMVSASLLTGCISGGSETSNSSTGGDSTGGTALAPQEGMRSALFYGNTNHTQLASVTNVRVIDPATPNTVTVTSDDITTASIGRPQPSTTLVGYNTSNHSYTDLYVDSVYYVKGGSPKRVSMTYWHDMDTHTDYSPEELAHSSASGLTAPSYKEVDYLGTKRILLAKDASGNNVLVCPTAGASEEPIPFNNKTFLTLSYDSYGAPYDGAVVYDTVEYKFQKMVPPSEACAACNDPGTPLTYLDYTGVTMTAQSTYKFLGDIAGTATAAVVVDGKLYIMDKANRTLTERTVMGSNTTVTLTDLLGATGKSVSKVSGDSAYFLYKESDQNNVYRVNFTTGTLTRLTSGYGDIVGTNAPTGINTFTDDWVIYGSDNVRMAVRKDAADATPIVLAENSKTSGIRYPFHFGIGSQYLYVTYNVDTTTGKTTYRACVFSADGSTACRDNSFWSNVVAARQGTLNFTSDYPYTPYAFVRVDDTDNFGGGTLKAVDPTKPLDDGFAMGKVSNYNFNTFLHAYYYHKTTVDTDGYIVIYGKHDDTFVGDAFLVNLRQANSVRNLTSEAAPSETVINGGKAHCHGRYCAVCHNFAGGKIYTNAAGTGSAIGYNIKLTFQDGSSVLARLGKGMGENFSVLYDAIKGEFTPSIVRVTDQSEIKRGALLGHSGLSYSNCDYCHARPGDVPTGEPGRYGAPGVIHIATE